MLDDNCHKKNIHKLFTQKNHRNAIIENDRKIVKEIRGKKCKK